MLARNHELIRVIKNALMREREKISRSEFEIWRLKIKLLELGEDFSLEELLNIPKPKKGKRL